MGRTTTLLGLIALLIVSASVAAQPRSQMPELALKSPAQPLDPARTEAFVDGIVSRSLDNDNIAGAVVSVVQGGRTILLKGYGVSSLTPRRPVDPSATRFRIGSIGKTFTWIEVMKLAESGQLNLYAPINSYLPAENRIPDQGFKKPIRMIDLMAHSAGFEDLIFGHLFTKSPETLVSTAEYLRRHRPNRVREPGVASSYSNYGAVLAGFVAARLAGHGDYPTAIERDILMPAGMTRTLVREIYPARAGLPAPLNPKERATLSKDFFYDGENLVERPGEFITPIAPAGIIYSTGADMARYMKILLSDGELENGGRVFGPQAAAAFRTPIQQLPSGFNGWPHGFFTQSLPGGYTSVGHNGATMYATSNMVLVPALDLGIFVNANTQTSDSLTAALPRLIVEHFYAPDDHIARAGNSALVSQAHRFEGTYLLSRRAYSKLEGFLGLLTSQSTVTVDRKGVLRIAGPGGGAFVSTADPAVFVSQDGRNGLRFDFAPGGRANGYRISDNGVVFEQAKWWQMQFVMQVLAAAGIFAALSTLVASLYRARTPQTLWQRRSSILAIVASAALLTAAGLAGVWMTMANDVAKVAYAWPGPILTPAVLLVLLTQISAVALTALLPAAVGRSGGWTLFRRVRHTAAVLALLALSLGLAAWGVAPPWA